MAIRWRWQGEGLGYRVGYVSLLLVFVFENKGHGIKAQYRTNALDIAFLDMFCSSLGYLALIEQDNGNSPGRSEL